MTETGATTDAMRQKFLALVEQVQDYERLPIARLLIRFKNDVSAAKAEAPYQRELTLARAKAHHDGRA